MSGASKRASGTVLQSVYLVILAHSGEKEEEEEDEEEKKRRRKRRRKGSKLRRKLRRENTFYDIVFFSNFDHKSHQHLSAGHRKTSHMSDTSYFIDLYTNWTL